MHDIAAQLLAAAALIGAMTMLVRAVRKLVAEFRAARKLAAAISKKNLTCGAAQG